MKIRVKPNLIKIKNNTIDLQQPAKSPTSSYSLHVMENDIIPLKQTQLQCRSSKDQRGCYLAVPTGIHNKKLLENLTERLCRTATPY